ncbi:MAG: hypothetical protein KDD12_08895, partial [Lewinella sp.]|nr:hypothetical protein [Lewinella sp.]
MAQKKHTIIEQIAEKLGIIPNLHGETEPELPRLTEPGDLTSFPPPDKWDDWTEYDPKAHPRKVKRHYS